MEEKVFHAGGVEFHVDNRNISGDGGPSVRVFGDTDGKNIQLLRFDCFRKTHTIIMTHQGGTIISVLIRRKCQIQLHGQLNNWGRISLK